MRTGNIETLSSQPFPEVTAGGDGERMINLAASKSLIFSLADFAGPIPSLSPLGFSESV